ncbi:hypothetical protein [Formosa algae]|uniref:Peptidylprolyl isomerase n=1 Tax=Formosa algae TaxID=225843 RepID=A0A9X0YK54_9FLAO|nr:hypothetical protein [Formosa algae]MBP1838386.1 hypothetical protein [Formosa algae]MDQ0334521.1 hypothetical protein [Formosa algae]OEI79068.1 hypothetical protein AST99_16275 [Formosa algae]
MKKILLVFTLVFSLGVFAQDAELEAFKDLFNSEKKTVIGEFLDLDATAAMIFNGIYDAYILERKEISNRRMSLLEKYVEQYDALTDEQADVIVKETFSIRAKSEKLQKKYYKKVKKELGAKTASQFVQFERYVQTSIDEVLQESLPLIGE